MDTQEAKKFFANISHHDAYHVHIRVNIQVSWPTKVRKVEWNSNSLGAIVSKDISSDTFAGGMKSPLEVTWRMATHCIGGNACSEIV